MLFKIISKKKYDKMHQELEELRGAHMNLHSLHKELYSKYQAEVGSLNDKVSELEKKLRRAENERNAALKKLGKKKS